MDREQRLVESIKLHYDTSKHASSVSIATAVVVVALFRDETPYGSLVLLVLSVFLSLLSMIAVAEMFLLRDWSPGLRARVRYLGLGAWVCWLVAVAWVVLTAINS